MQDNLNHLKVQVEMPEWDLKKSFDEPGEPDILEGMVNIQAEFESHAAFIKEIPKNMDGDFSIKGRNLILKSADLDRALEELKTITPTPENENAIRKMREKIEESARRASARDTGDGG